MDLTGYYNMSIYEDWFNSEIVSFLICAWNLGYNPFTIYVPSNSYPSAL